MTKVAATDVAVHELIARRWSPRAFADRSITEAQLDRLLEAARWAPSSFNGQPWAFLVATREEADNFARLLGCLVEFNQTWARSASALAIAVAQLNFSHNQQPNRHAWYDLGLAVGNLTVQATAEGLFVHQMGGFNPAQARAEFRIPDGWEPVAALAIGYLGDPQQLPDGLRERELAAPQRKPRASFVFRGQWGEA